MAQRRSEPLQLVAYALARCRVATERLGHKLPPPWLGVTRWRDAYELFLPALSDGRDTHSFRNTLKNARYAFDAHLPNARPGWVDYADGGRPWQQAGPVRTMLDWRQARDERELTDAVLALLAGRGGFRRGGRREARTEEGRRVWQSSRYERSAAHMRDAVALQFQ